MPQILQSLVFLYVFTLMFSTVSPFECGQQKVKKLSSSLIHGGNKSHYGQWPWLASLHKSEPKEHHLTYFCGASIIKPNTLVTAAHCIHETSSYDLYALFGRFNLSDNNEKNWVKRSISQKIPHEDYSESMNQARSNGDIGILLLEEPVTFTDHIQPICLPSLNQNVVGIQGIVAGYGRKGQYELASKIPLYVLLTSFDLITCYSSSVEASRVVSVRSFCARSSEGIPCYGDSGSGFVSKVEDKWTLLGVVSQTLDIECRKNGIVVLAAVANFINWLTNTATLYTQTNFPLSNINHKILNSCTVNEDCESKAELCISTTCVNICKDTNCGSRHGARCEAEGYKPVCMCDAQYKWSLNISDCMQCLKNEDCKTHEVCDDYTCIDACSKISCDTQYGTQCEAENHKAFCSCPLGHNCRVCSQDSDCSDNKVCSNFNCVRTCNHTVCNSNSRCIINQGKFQCECLNGFTKNTFGECIKVTCEKLFCPLFSTCYQTAEKAECRCIDGLTINNINTECQFECDGGLNKFSPAQKCNYDWDCKDATDEQQCIQGYIQEKYWEDDCEVNINIPQCRFGPLKTYFISEDAKIDSKFAVILAVNDITIEKLKNARKSFFKVNKSIKFLPFAIFEKLPNLIEIELVLCAVKQITQENFMRLNKLRILNLSNNRIEIIDEKSFNDLESLEEIHLNGNKIANLTEKVFSSLRLLELINLGGNKLSDISENLFENCINLKLVDLSGNQISSVPSKIFKNLKDLEKIILSYNKIVQLSSNLFQNNKRLKEIDFEYNNELMKIDPNIFDGLDQLMTIDLGSKSCMKNNAYYNSKSPLTVEQKQQLKKDLMARCN